jgi:hypothetical protein
MQTSPRGGRPRLPSARCAPFGGDQKLSLDNWQVSYEKQIAIIDTIMKRVIEYCKVRNAV